MKHKILVDDKAKMKELLLSKPFTLLQAKTGIIIEQCKKYKNKRLLEVGSFLGASAFLFAKNMPDVQIVSIDKNNHSEYFGNPNNNNVKYLLTNWYEGYEIRIEDFPVIQKFYNSQFTNLSIITATIDDVDLKEFDAFIIDGDHNPDVINYELHKIYNLNIDALIFVDDCSYKHINKPVVDFCKDKNLKLEYKYKDNDLAIIRIIK